MVTYVAKKHLPRRTVLKGLGGVALALPFLDAMTPAFAKAVAAPKRLAFVYFPDGYIKDQWTPDTEGAGFTFKSSLEPLAPYRQKTLILSGLANDPENTVSGLHDRAIQSFMTGVEGSRTELNVGTSVDQIAAASLGQDVPLASLELGVQEVGTFGSPCFQSATNRLPIETDPVRLFARLFGEDGALDPQMLAGLREERSILDTIVARLKSLDARLGADDRAKMAQYAQSVRDVEHRLAMAEKRKALTIPMPRPGATPPAYPDHARLMFDLQVAAFQTDSTRVCTFMMGQEASSQTYPEIGWTMSDHVTSHHGGNPEKIAANARIKRHHTEIFADFIARLDAIQEPNGSLLDNSLVMYGSSLGDASRHIRIDLPIVLMGGSNAGVKSGRHLKLPDRTPLPDLYLTLLDKAGAPVDRLGYSTGPLKGVSAI